MLAIFIAALQQSKTEKHTSVTDRWEGGGSKGNIDHCTLFGGRGGEECQQTC